MAKVSIRCTRDVVSVARIVDLKLFIRQDLNRQRCLLDNMILAEIRCPFEQEIVDVFATEEKEFQNGRARYTMDKQADELVFSVSARDFVALRAMMNAITKNLSIHHKVNELVGDEDD